MFLKNYILFSSCLIVFFIYGFDVRHSICHGFNFGSEDPPEPPQEGATPKSIDEALLKLIDNPPLRFVTVSVPLVFEGVDYDLMKNLSSKTYDYYYDCFYWATKCIRDKVHFQTVCAYSDRTAWTSFANICVLELENCRYRVRVESWKPFQGIFGMDKRHKHVDNLSTAGTYCCDTGTYNTVISDSSPSLNIVTQNIHSIQKNLDSFQSQLARFSFDFDLIILTVCWLNPIRPIPPIDDYATYSSKTWINQNDDIRKTGYLMNSRGARTYWR